MPRQLDPRPESLNEILKACDPHYKTQRYLAARQLARFLLEHNQLTAPKELFLPLPRASWEVYRTLVDTHPDFYYIATGLLNEGIQSSLKTYLDYDPKHAVSTTQRFLVLRLYEVSNLSLSLQEKVRLQLREREFSNSQRPKPK